jgi:hypothetical protein
MHVFTIDADMILVIIEICNRSVHVTFVKFLNFQSTLRRGLFGAGSASSSE